jgi:hypothetical protein
LSHHRPAGYSAGNCPLRVVCGDAVGLTVLARWVGKTIFPIWCISFDDLPVTRAGAGGAGGAERGGQVIQAGFANLAVNIQLPAEIVSALMRCLDAMSDRETTADRLRDALVGLEISARDRAALGRSIAFTRAGERRGDDLGHVLLVLPERVDVLALTRDDAGKWGAPTAVSVGRVPSPTTAGARP